MDYQMIAILVTAVLSIGVVGLGVKKYYEPFKEAGVLLVKISDALEDGKITKEELTVIIKRARGLINTIKKLLGGKK